MTTKEILECKKALFIPVEGEIKEIEPKNGSDFQLKEVYELLKIELIECVYIPNNNNKIMLVDEEGMLKTFVINERASAFCSDCYQSPCTIFGDVLVVFNNQFK